MEVEIKKLSTNRFKINGLVYKRVKSEFSCTGCYFSENHRCKIHYGSHCYEISNNVEKFYHLMPNEL